MSPTPLVLVSGLTAGDYLLWNWSLGANHDVLALMAGLTLPPLIAACALMFVLGGLRALGRSRHRVIVSHRSAPSQARETPALRELRESPLPSAEEIASAVAEPDSAGAETSGEPPRKLAA